MASRFDKYLTDDDRAAVADTRDRTTQDQAAFLTQQIHARAIAGYTEELAAADATTDGRADDAAAAETTAATIAAAIAADEAELATGIRPDVAAAADVDVEPAEVPVKLTK